MSGAVIRNDDFQRPEENTAVSADVASTVRQYTCGRPDTKLGGASGLGVAERPDTRALCRGRSTGSDFRLDLSHKNL
jgi:hypothetical protein